MRKMEPNKKQKKQCDNHREIKKEADIDGKDRISLRAKASVLTKSEISC